MRPVILETERLQLLEMTPDDRPALSAILQDEAVMYAYNGAFDRCCDFSRSGAMLSADKDFHRST